MRQLVSLLSTVVLAATLLQPAQVLAASGAAVHFQGTFFLGQQPAPAGTTLTVIVARSVNDVTICGTGSVNSASGQFRVDTQATPPCVNTATSRSNGPLIFVANGENVGGCGCLPSLDSPSTLGHTQTLDLRGTPISQFAGGSTSGSGMPVPAIRLWGTLTLAGAPAPTGTTITASTSLTQAACGQGSVIDNSGTYWLDVPATTSCTTSRAGGDPGAYVLTVNGENVGGCGCLPSLDSPAGLGHTNMVDLHGQLAAPKQNTPLLTGSVSTTPEEQAGQPAPDPKAGLSTGIAAPADCAEAGSCQSAASELSTCLQGTETACGTAITDANMCLADQTASVAARSFCAGVIETLGSLGAAACAAPLLVVTIACQPTGDPERPVQRATPDPNQPQPILPNQPQPQPSQPDPNQPQPILPNQPQPQPSQPDPTQPQPILPDPNQPQPQPQPAQPDPGQPQQQPVQDPTQPQPQPQQRPLPIPGPTQTRDENNLCNYRGGVLTYAAGNPLVGIDHILEGHRRTAAVRNLRGAPQGIFFGNYWPGIQPVIDQANADPASALAWIRQGGLCVLHYRFANVIGWDDPPTAPTRPPGATGQPTACLRIVIFNQPSPAGVLTAYPEPC
jgi:hypothetical protein